MIIPMPLINIMRDLHFSMKLCRIIKRLCDEDYSINIYTFKANPRTDPLDRTIALDIRVHKGSENVVCFDEHYRCLIPKEYDLHHVECTEKYNQLADLIYEKVFKTIDATKPHILTVSKEESAFLKNFKEELTSRGDFTVDIPKLVDVLFKLGVMIPKEDVETSEPDEIIEDKEIPW